MQVYDQCFTCMTELNQEKKQKKITLYIPEDIVKAAKQSAKRHHRSFNGEAVFGIETYLTYFSLDANSPKRPL